MGCFVKAKAGQNLSGACRRRVCVDVGQAQLDVGNAVRVGGVFRFVEQARAFGVGGKDPFNERCVAARRFLRHMADADVARR